MRLIHRLGIAGLAATAGLLCYASASQATPQPTPAPQPHVTPHVTPHVASAPSATGDVFTPLAPCRIVDTRVAGGRLGNDQGRAFYVTGTGSFTSQGGPSTGCGVPLDSDAVSLSITATGASANGRLVAYPNGTTAPGSTSLSYLHSANMTASTVTKLAPGGGKQLAIHNYKASTHIVVDVTGYYSKPIQVTVSSSGLVLSGGNGVNGVLHSGTGSYTITTQRDLTGCSPYSNAEGGVGYSTSAYVSGHNVYVTGFTFPSGSPTLTDMYFEVTVVC